MSADFFTPESLTAFAKQYAATVKASFNHDRSRTIGSSEIGRCARRAAYKRSSIKPDKADESNGYAFRGDILEDNYMVPLARHIATSVGGELLFAGQADQLSLESEDTGQSATPDGLIAFRLNVQPAFMLEFKSRDPRKAVRNLPEQAHLDQVNQAIGLMRMVWDELTTEDGELFPDVYGPAPDYGILIYVNASDVFELTPFRVEFSQEDFDGQGERARMILANVENPDSLTPEGKVSGGKDCGYCEFSETCLGFAGWVPRQEKPLNAEEEKRISALATQALEASTIADTAKQSAEEARAALKTELAIIGTKRATIGSVKVEWQSRAEREVFDMDALKRELTARGVDVERFKKKTKPSESLSVETV